MCIKCTYLQENPPRWTCMSYGSYNKTGGLTSECDPKCKKWQSVQKHKFCFHASHATPPPWDQCGQIRWHKEDLLLILHPQQSVPLPNPLVDDAFSRKARVDSRFECYSRNAVSNITVLAVGLSDVHNWNVFNRNRPANPNSDEFARAEPKFLPRNKLTSFAIVVCPV